MNLWKLLKDVEPWQWAVVGGGVVLATSFLRSGSQAALGLFDPLSDAEILDATKIPVPPLSQWVKVEEGGRVWLVAPTYIAPTGIGEAFRVAALHGSELPTPSLVDAIWRAADVKVEPTTQTPGPTMNSVATHRAQQRAIASQVERADPQHKGRLFAGMYKDVVSLNGQHGIYGWHHLNGTKIQGFSGNAHDDGYKDYSQGARLVRRVS